MQTLAVRFGRIPTVVAWLLLALALSTASFASEYTAEQKDRLIEAIGKRLESSAVAFGVDWSTWPSIVARHQAEIDSAASESDLENVLRSALDEYGVSHLSLFSKSSGKLARAGKRSGMGISIRKMDQGIFVTYVLESSPAWKLGIRKRDIITAIDGLPISDVSQLAGQIGDRRNLQWLRDGETMSGEIEYAVFPVAERSGMRWLTDDVALITIQSFQYRFYDIAAVNRFFREARNAKAIVLDLRNNRGGLSFYARHLASKIGRCRDTYGLLVNRRAYRRALSQNNGYSPNLDELAAVAKRMRPLPFSRPYRGRVVVLIDSLSASGGDLFPAFMKELHAATLIGERSAGAVQLARTFPLPYGFRLYVPIGEILTPNGQRLEGVGVSPDIELDFRDTANDDLILQLALEEATK